MFGLAAPRIPHNVAPPPSWAPGLPGPLWGPGSPWGRLAHPRASIRSLFRPVAAKAKKKTEKQ